MLGALWNCTRDNQRFHNEIHIGKFSQAESFDFPPPSLPQETFVRSLTRHFHSALQRTDPPAPGSSPLGESGYSSPAFPNTYLKSLPPREVEPAFLLQGISSSYQGCSDLCGQHGPGPCNPGTTLDPENWQEALRYPVLVSVCDTGPFLPPGKPVQ